MLFLILQKSNKMNLYFEKALVQYKNALKPNLTMRITLELRHALLILPKSNRCLC